MKSKTDWTNEEDQYLVDNFSIEDYEVMTKKLNRTKASIKARAHILFLSRRSDEYALYKGEQLLAMGTAEEIAAQQNVNEMTIRFYASPSYQRRSDGIKIPSNRRVLVKL